MKKRLSLLSLAAIIMFSCSYNNTSANINNANTVKINSSDIDSSSESLSSNQDFQVVRTIDNPKFWNKIELIRTTDSSVSREKMLYKGRHRDADIIKAFGTDQPPSTDFCLHDMGAPKELKHNTPVLLIHGANTTATRAWVDPDGNGNKTGLGQYLKAQGFRVFAVTFANKHGDNFIWASHVNRAIQRIKSVTGSEKVDALGHSKGAFTLRIFTSNVYGGNTNPFHKDLRTAIFVGAPHRGIDFSFRHPVINLGLYPQDDDPVKYAPLTWTKTLWLGTWHDSKDLSIMSDYFTGQPQMVAKLDSVNPLPVAEQDWYTTYHGGQGLISFSEGIDAAITKGGNLIEKLRKSPVDPSVRVANLCGNSPTVPGILNEYTGTSDGVVFTYSACASEDLTGSGAKLLSAQTMALNHLELVSDTKAMEWVAKQFSAN